ncbi:MAG: 1-deoxy-D-xylulose-5-phosphate synthase, partial [Corynebacterium sp.]|nr:1-deoxy-D-xylulose-5-phosphate synthase [Corynebacterium sp.]
NDGPTVVRFPKGDLPVPQEAVHTLEDGVDILAYLEAESDADEAVAADDIPDVLIVSVGERAIMSLELAARLVQNGVNVTVVDPGWVVPIPQSLVALTADHDLVITIEDGVIHGGVGSLLSDALNAAEVDTPRRQVGVPQKFLDHGTRGQVQAEHGLDVDSVEATVNGWLERLFGDQS